MRRCPTATPVVVDVRPRVASNDGHRRRRHGAGAVGGRRAGAASGRPTVRRCARAAEVFPTRLPGADGEDAFPLEGDAASTSSPIGARRRSLLELPLAPLCRDDCAGLCPTCGADRNVERATAGTESVDPRWAALDELAVRRPDADDSGRPGAVRAAEPLLGLASLVVRPASRDRSPTMAVPKKKKSRRRAAAAGPRLEARRAGPQHAAPAAAPPSCRTSCAAPAAGTRAVGRRRRLTVRPSALDPSMLPIAVDAMGGDKAPGEIVAGARRAADEPASPSCSSGGPTTLGRRRRPARSWPPPRSSTMDDDPAPGRAAQEGLVARAGRRGGARRQGVGHGLGRQHRRHDGRARCCAWAASRA